MKTLLAVSSCPEPLEVRIAPATLVNPTTVTFTDVDGDDVTVKITKGTLDLAQNFVFAASGAGEQLRALVLTDAEFAGTNITITAKRNATNGGDGFVNVGHVNATGRDLGAVSIAGDLGQIDAGDADVPNVAVKSLTVQSMGLFGTTTQAGGGNLGSSLTGAINSITVHGDFVDANFSSTSSLGSLKVGGSILGATNANSGIFNFTAIGNVTIGGSIIGGSGPGSGRILAALGIDAVKVGGSLIGNGIGSGRIETTTSLDGSGDLGPVTIGGDIRGGAGNQSGVVAATGKLLGLSVGGSLIGGAGLYDTLAEKGQIFSEAAMGPVKIGRDVIGGGQAGSGGLYSLAEIKSVTVNGSLLGGDGLRSASISAASLGAVKIGGSVLGGLGEDSASIRSGSSITSVTIGGSVIGGGGINSAYISANDRLGAVKIGRDLIGGDLNNSGRIDGENALLSVTIGGSVIGGAGNFSGRISSDEGATGSVKIGGHVRGGGGEKSGSIEAGDRLGSVTIGGSVSSSTGLFSGSIMSRDDIPSLTIAGSVLGTAANPVVISAEDATAPTATANVAIGKVSIGGNVHFAEIRAGYDDNVLEEAGAQIGSVTVGGDWMASIIVASINPTNGIFGDGDDLVQSGAPSTLLSKIGKVAIKGQALGTIGGTDGFGIVAQTVGAVTVGAVKYPLTADSDVFALGTTGDFFVRDFGPPNAAPEPPSPGMAAPTLVNDRTVTFRDGDGDDVTVTITKGTLDLMENFVFTPDGLGLQLQRLILTNEEFAGTNITITAKRNATNGGDGSVNVGYIDATNFDLGTVKIAGDLGAIDAGDATAATFSLKSLSVQSLGLFGLTTGAPDLQSDLDGRVGSITIRGDLREAVISVFDRAVDMGTPMNGTSGDGEAFLNSLTIGGSIYGGSTNASGIIAVRDGLLKATIGGSIVGGGGISSGIIHSFDSLGDITVRGSLIGGGGNSSGQIIAQTEAAKSITIGGSVLGGVGPSSGRINLDDFDGNVATSAITIGGSIVGGAGQQGGVIDFDGPVKKVSIGGSIQGGSAQFTGQAMFQGAVGTFTLGGSIIADANFSAEAHFDAGAQSVSILGSIIASSNDFGATLTINDVTGKLLIGGSIIGGGQFSGAVSVETLISGTVGGGIIGGAEPFSGTFSVDTSVAKLTIGEIRGGSGPFTGTLEGKNFGKVSVLGNVSQNGQITVTAGGLSSLTIGGSVLDGSDIQVSAALGTLKVAGAIRGTAANPATIAAGGDIAMGDSALSIGSLDVKGSVAFTRILAGYDETATALNADAQIGKVTIGGDWMASSLVAGVQDDTDAPLDASFGEIDDQAIAGGDPEISSRIASITIKGQLLGTAGGTDSFGFVAQQIGALKIGKVTYPLTAGVDILPLGATGDFNAREDV